MNFVLLPLAHNFSFVIPAQAQAGMTSLLLPPLWGKEKASTPRYLRRAGGGGGRWGGCGV